MPVLLKELIDKLPLNTEKRVQDTKKRFIQIIQGEIRKESGLLLNRQIINPGIHHTGSVSIPVTVTQGIPVSLRHLTFDDEYWNIAPLLPHRALLKNLADSSLSINNILENIHKNPRSIFYQSPSVDFIDFGRYANILLTVLDSANPVISILEINEDVLGSYIFASSPTVYLSSPKIELYWGVIGLVASMLSISPESLTCVVLSHELAHGYTHMGSDIDGERWDTYAFQHSERALVEGMAQYYTHLACQRIENRVSGTFAAYNELLMNQPDDYRTHLKWIEAYSPEIVRMAIIEARRNKITAISDFDSILKSAASRL